MTHRPTELIGERAWQCRALVDAGTATSTRLTDSELVAYLMTLSGHDGKTIALTLGVTRQRGQQLRFQAFEKVFGATGLGGQRVNFRKIFYWHGKG